MKDSMQKDEMLKVIREIAPLKPETWLEVLILSKHIKIPPGDFAEGKKVFEALYEVIKTQRELKKASEPRLPLELKGRKLDGGE